MSWKEDKRQLASVGKCFNLLSLMLYPLPLASMGLGYTIADLKYAHFFFNKKENTFTHSLFR